ncbi:hypothetical protein F1188_11040 [Roseospira marina]|uniref:Uncharacterized protein n=1 Tax=Roseospira marina TaxID=140057 RepID=A0A5M6ICD9_9PROT|nr:hypothetical protein [Roseospira marina]KAA5605429.1 hypothetical protein F1188_11040 [Roseospira marina]MBB4314576.1 hypothetical protein [Roseospira marina]MBB5088862.1 hypothetical protein [Roseospira marina]
MAAILDAGAIATQALRAIGHLAPIDSAADAAEHQIALTWLDIVLAELAETERLWPLVPTAQAVPLVAGQDSYRLAMHVVPQFAVVTRLGLRDAAGRETPVALVRRADWDAIDDKTAVGMPEAAHLLDDEAQTLRLWPTPADANRTLVVTGQRHSADITTRRGGSVPHGLSPGWNRFLIKAVAAEIAGGPVLTLPVGERDRLRAEAMDAKARLLAHRGREQVDRPRRVRPWGQ